MRLVRKLRIDVLPGSTGACAGRIATLGHEAFDHAVKHDAVVKPIARQLLDPRHMLRREIGAQSNDDTTVVKVHEKGVFGVLDCRI